MSGNKSKIDGTVYITIESYVENSFYRGFNNASYKETFLISKSNVVYTLVDETVKKMTDKDNNSTHDISTVVTEKHTYEMESEDDLISMLESFKTGVFSKASNESFDQRAWFKVHITEKMVPWESVIYFNPKNPYLLLEIWNYINHLSKDLKKDIFPKIIEEYTRRYGMNLDDENVYHDLINAIAASGNAKDNYPRVLNMIQNNKIKNCPWYIGYYVIDDCWYVNDDMLNENKYIIFSDKGIYFDSNEVEKNDNNLAITFKSAGILDFLSKYENAFSDLEELSSFLVLCDYSQEAAGASDAINKIKELIYDIKKFVSTNNISNISGREDNYYFEPENKHVLDYFNLLLYLTEKSRGKSVKEVCQMIIDYNSYSSVSIDDAIKHILEVQTEKQYYVVGNDLYCCKDHVAYRYTNERQWAACDYFKCIGDYLIGFDESEQESSPYRFGKIYRKHPGGNRRCSKIH